MPVKEALQCGGTLLQQWIRASPTVDLTSMIPDSTARASPELCHEVIKCLSEVPDIPKLVVHLELERNVTEAVTEMCMQVRLIPPSFSHNVLEIRYPNIYVCHESCGSLPAVLLSSTVHKSFRCMFQ